MTLEGRREKCFKIERGLGGGRGTDLSHSWTALCKMASGRDDTRQRAVLKEKSYRRLAQSSREVADDGLLLCRSILLIISTQWRLLRTAEGGGWKAERRGQQTAGTCRTLAAGSTGGREREVWASVTALAAGFLRGGGVAAEDVLRHWTVRCN